MKQYFNDPSHQNFGPARVQPNPIDQILSDPDFNPIFYLNLHIKFKSNLIKNQTLIKFFDPNQIHIPPIITYEMQV